MLYTKSDRVNPALPYIQPTRIIIIIIIIIIRWCTNCRCTGARRMRSLLGVWRSPSSRTYTHGSKERKEEGRRKKKKHTHIHLSAHYFSVQLVHLGRHQLYRNRFRFYNIEWIDNYH